MHSWLDYDKSRLITLTKRVPNVLLIQGNKYLGISQLALWYAQTLLCENIDHKYGACNNCQNCLLFVSGAIINFKHLALSDDKKSITIDDIRQVIEYISISSHNNTYKIVLIEDVDKLNLSSANALLKILEEAPNYAVFILTCNNRNQVIPTILSRCHQYLVKPPSLETILKYVKTNEISKFWLNFYNNCPVFEEPMDYIYVNKLIDTLANPSVDNIFELTKDIDSKNISFAMFLDFFSKWIFDLVQLKITKEIRYFAESKVLLNNLINELNVEYAFYLFDQVNYLSARSSHPLNYKLQTENILFNYQMLFIKS